MRRTLVAFILSLGLSACGGVEEADPSNIDQATPATESGVNDISAMGLPGCGAFRQTCCLTGAACNYGLECDPASRTCLH